MQEGCFTNSVKGRFLKTGTCTVYADCGSVAISRTFEISDPYLTSNSTILSYGKEATVEVTNRPTLTECCPLLLRISSSQKSNVLI